MASPVDSARQGTNIATAATSHNINVGSPVAGTLLIVFVRFAAAPGTVTFTGYTQFAADTSDASDDDSRLYYRWADGAEAATDTLATTNSVKLAAICWEITGAENPATTPPAANMAVIGTAANINPRIGGMGVVASPGVTQTVRSVQGVGGVNEMTAESFVAGTTSVVLVGATLSKTGTPTDNLIIEIQTDSGGVPSGTVVGTAATIAGSSLTVSVSYVENPCSVSGLTPGNTYWLVFRRSGTRDVSNRPEVTLYDSSWPGGEAKTRNSGSWSAESSDVQMHIVFGDARDLLFLTVVGMDHETATATQPAGYSNLASANSGTGGAVATNCMIWGASKSTTGTTSDDPAAWTSTAPTTGVTAWTIAVPPSAAAAPAAVKRWRPSTQVAVMRPALR